jgi:hypothetical protein
MASAQKIVAFNDKRESVWDTDWICDFKTCPGNGYVVDHAINATAIIENDGSCLQSPMALGLSTLSHGQIVKVMIIETAMLERSLIFVITQELINPRPTRGIG